MQNNKISKAIKLALAFGAASTISISSAAFSEEVENKEGVDEVERIEVTGSRIRRIDLEPTQPIDSISSDYITDRGLTNAMDAVTELPGVFAASTPLIADNQAANSQGVGQRTINIYGLGSQRTLTLVNGGRMVSSNSPVGGETDPGSQVDVNNIPVALIERVEIVKVGGAPVYGADAVAGVVNYILKKDYEGAEFSYDYTDYDSYGQETSFKGLIGGNFGGDKGNLVLSFEHNKVENIPASRVPYLAKDWTNATPFDDDKVAGPDGIPSNQTRLYPDPRAGILSFSGLVSPGGTALTNFGLGKLADGNFYHFDPAGSGNLVEYDAGTPLDSPVWASGGDGLDLGRTNTALEGYERYNITAIANYALTEDINLNITAFANSSDSSNPGYQAAQYNSGIWNGTDGGALKFNTSHPYLNDQARGLLEGTVGENGDFYYHRGWINLGAREIINESSVRSLRATLEGTLELGDTEWDWNVSYQKGMSSVFSQTTSLSDARFFAAMDVGVNPETGAIDCKYNYVEGYGDELKSSGFGLQDSESILGPAGECAPLNPFGTITDAARDYVMVNAMGKTRVEQNIFNAYITGEVFELPAGPLQMAAGYERRIESASYASDGTTMLLGFANDATEGSYNTEDIFAELYVPIVDAGMDIPLVHSLSSEMSFRRIDNSRSGEDDVWAFGLNYRPIEDVIIRANIAETVRAPAVTELFLPRVESSQFGADPCQDTNLENGPNPAVRKANCAAEGIPADFKSDAAVASRQGIRGGNPDLQNEKAESKNVGIIYSPSYVDGLTLSVDWVEISIEDAIVQFTLTDIMEACYDGTDYPNKFCNSFTRLANHQLPPRNAFQSGYVNAAFRNFESIEYGVHYVQPVVSLPLIGSFFSEGAGELDIKFRAFNLKEDAESNTGFDFTDDTGQYDSPDWRSQLTVTHRLDDLTTFVGVSYHGEGARNIENEDPYKYIDQNGNPYMDIDSQTLVNIGATYHLNDMFTFRVNIDNATDWRADPKEVSLARFAWGRTFNVGVTARF